MKTFKAQFLLGLLLAFVFQFSQPVEAANLTCRQLFEQNSAFLDLLNSTYGRELITRPEISKRYEAELTQILMNEEIEITSHLRDGLGKAYKGKIKKYGLTVVAKRYLTTQEYSQLLFGDAKSRAKQINEFEKNKAQQLKNEVAAWLVSRLTGLDVFPFGVLREINGETYWVQLFIDVEKPSSSFVHKNNVESNIEDSPSGVRDYLLSYLLGDVDHGGNSLYHLGENRKFYIDAGSAFEIANPEEIRKSKNVNGVYPFVLYGKPLSKEQVMQDLDFFKAFVKLKPKAILKEIGYLLPNRNSHIDFELHFLKAQQQINEILASIEN